MILIPLEVIEVVKRCTPTLAFLIEDIRWIAGDELPLVFLVETEGSLMPVHID